MDQSGYFIWFSKKGRRTGIFLDYLYHFASINSLFFHYAIFQINNDFFFKKKEDQSMFEMSSVIEQFAESNAERGLNSAFSCLFHSKLLNQC